MNEVESKDFLELKKELNRNYSNLTNLILQLQNEIICLMNILEQKSESIMEKVKERNYDL